ncbi:hypothetical protein Tco_0085162 [Tanacetum coccineum]
MVIDKGDFSNKSSAVHEKPHTPRSCLRWKPTGRIFKTVSLRWIPTGKVFIDSTTKVDSTLTQVQEFKGNQNPDEQSFRMMSVSHHSGHGSTRKIALLDEDEGITLFSVSEEVMHQREKKKAKAIRKKLNNFRRNKVATRAERHDHEGSKKQKTNEALGFIQEQPEEEETELPEEELQQMMMVVPVEEVYVEALEVKYPIIDWEVYSEDTRKNLIEIYLDKLWSLVKERFSSTDPTYDKERTLWVKLKRLFEPDVDDILWKLQRYMHDPLTWRLYIQWWCSPCSTDRRDMIYFMQVEKDYPLSKGVLMLMLVNKLLVEQYSEMANELLKKIFILANRPRQ